MMPDLQDIMDWEEGKMDLAKEVEFFQDLIDSGYAWMLQGCYGRRAAQLIAAGKCSRKDESNGT